VSVVVVDAKEKVVPYAKEKKWKQVLLRRKALILKGWMKARRKKFSLKLNIWVVAILVSSLLTATNSAKSLRWKEEEEEGEEMEGEEMEGEEGEEESYAKQLSARAGLM